jgi:hypothetical protein
VVTEVSTQLQPLVAVAAAAAQQVETMLTCPTQRRRLCRNVLPLMLLVENMVDNSA